MKKELYWMFICLIVIITATAISIDQIITQSQLDSFDFDTLNLSESFVKVNGKVKHECDNNKICTFWVKHKGVNNNINNSYDNKENNSYTTTWIESPIKTRAVYWINLKNEKGKPYAVNKLTVWLTIKAEELITRYRKDLKRMQTQVNIDMQDLVNDLDL